MSLEEVTGVSITDFSKLAGVSKQAISKAVKKGTLKKTGSLIDPDDPMNARYLLLKQRGNGDQKYKNDNEDASSPAKTVKINPAAKEFLTKKEQADIDLKISQKRKIDIQNARELEELISKDLVKLILGEISQSVNKNFVLFSRRNAAHVTAIAINSPDSIEVEKYLSDEIEAAINAVKKDCDKWLKSDHWMK